MSSDMDAIPVSADPPLGPPEGWPSSTLGAELRRVLLAATDVRAATARRMGLNPSDLDAIEHLMGQRIGPVELSRRLHMTSASATVLVGRLEAAGHVVREPDPADGRRRVVRPTRQGAEAVLAQVRPLVADLVSAEDGMTEREREVVRRYLSRVDAVLRAHAGTGREH